MSTPQFVPRYFEDILIDMVNMIRTVTPELTDFNIGSRIRTLLETSSLEDDEQYHQMVALLLLWNLDNLRGRDLDERLSEYGVSRNGALSSSGQVVISNGNLVTSFMTASASTGSGTLQVLSSAGFPTSGFPVSLRIGEGTSNVEIVNMTGNNPSSKIISISALTKDHGLGERVSYIVGGVLVVPSGTQIKIRSYPEFPNISASTQEAATISPGFYDSNEVVAISDFPGSTSNVGPGSFVEFVGSPPFDGALLRHDAPFVGGRDIESDDEFRDRGRKKLQSLARATVLALEQLVLGASYTGLDGRTWEVRSASVIEYWDRGPQDYVNLYIWPGAFDFVQAEDVTVPGSLTIVGGAEEGLKFLRLNDVAVVPSTLQLQQMDAGTAVWRPLTQGVDFFFNEGTGWIEIVDPGLSKGDQVRYFRYRHYTGLIQEAQKLVDGVPIDRVRYPGIRAAGVKVLVTYPRLQKINPIRAGIQVRQGYTESEVGPLVSDAISLYLSELRVGDDVIVAEMIERAMGVAGMFNVKFTSPTDDIVLLQDEILDLENLDIIIS